MVTIIAIIAFALFVYCKANALHNKTVDPNSATCSCGGNEWCPSCNGTEFKNDWG